MRDSQGCRITRLINESDWQKCKKSLSSIGSPQLENPWANWDHYYFIAHKILINCNYYYIEVFDNEQTLAGCVFREENGKRMKMKFKTLRSLDWATMCIPPMIVKNGFEEDSYKLLISNLDYIHQQTGADLLCLYQQRKRYCKPLINNLKQHDIIFDTKEMSNSQIIDTSTFKQRVNLKKRLKHLRKNEEKLEQDFGSKPEFQRYRGDIFNEIQENGLWNQFKQLWNSSWQKNFISQNDKSKGEESFRCFADPIERWSKQGWLDFCVLTLNGQALSIYLNVAINGEVDLLTTVYDPEFEDYAAGTINLTHTILDSIERKDKILDFGGEAVTWKRRWSTNESPILLHEIPLGGLKSKLWSLNKQVGHSTLKGSRVEFHNIQNKKEFQKLLSGKKTSIMHEQENCIIKALKTEADWQSIKQEMQKFEIKCEPNPWQNFDHCYNYWKSFHRDKTCWMISVLMPEGRSKGWLSNAFLLEQQETRKKISFKVLRSLDQMAMRISPFMVFTGMEHEATRAILHCLGELGKISGADLISLYRLDTKYAEILLEELRCMNIPHKDKIFTFSKYAILPDDFELYKKSLGKRINSQVRRTFNQSEKHFGEKIEVLHFNGTKRDEHFDWMWSEFERLREGSWQYENAQKKSLVDTQILTEYFRSSIDSWLKSGMVQLTLITLKNKAVAGLLSLMTEARSYGFLMAYDREYAKYSFGVAGLIKHLEDIHSQGFRNIEFGGEGSDWKSKWATGEDAIYQIEIGLGSPKSLLWQTINYFKTIKDTPVR